MRRRLGSITWIVPGVKARIRVSAGFDPLTGARRKLDRTVLCNARGAERELARMELEAGVVPSARDLTVKAYLTDMWYPSLERRRAQRLIRRETIDGYRSKCDCHVIPLVGSAKLSRLDPYTLDRMFGTLAERGASPHTAHHVYRVLHNALNQAVRWRLIDVNPLDAVDVPKRPKRELHTLSIAEADAVLAAFAGHPLEPIVLLALGAGLRRSELAAVDWSDMRFYREEVAQPDGSTVVVERGEVKVWRGLHAAKKADAVWIEDPKTPRSARTLALSPGTLAALRPLRGIGPLAMDGDERMRPDAISAAFRKRLKAAGLSDIPLRDLRHTHATILLRRGANLLAVSRRLGHSTVTTTDIFYADFGLDDDREAAAFFDAPAPDGTDDAAAQDGTRK